MFSRACLERKLLATTPINPKSERMAACRYWDAHRLTSSDGSNNDSIDRDIVGAQSVGVTLASSNCDVCLVAHGLTQEVAERQLSDPAGGTQRLQPRRSCRVRCHVGLIESMTQCHSCFIENISTQTQHDIHHPKHQPRPHQARFTPG